MSLKIVNTSYGKIAGIEKEEYTLFKGIPYAKPPVGNLRWKAPQKLEPWTGIYQANAFSCKSMQEEMDMPFYDKEFYSSPEYSVKSSEDSLYLNIWTPAKKTDDKLPVVFWIHGGAFMGGYGSEIEFDGEKYCQEKVILVTLNYRLNIFGFLAHPWFCEESEHHVAGNYGILDQIAALKWVKNNIQNFGGDPDNITVMGQSAGAMSVQTLICSPLTGNNIIAKAVMQSGGGYDNGMNDKLTLTEALEYGKIFVDMTGAKTVEELRNKSSDELYQTLGKFMKIMMERGSGLIFKPIIDGYVLEKFYDELIEEGKVKKIPYLLGSNKNDIFVDKKDVDAGIKSRLYQGCVAFSHKLVKMGHAAPYVYYFKRNLPGDDAGAFHSSELWYTFGSLKRCWRPMTKADYALSQRMVEYWTEFARTGNPNKGDDPCWKPCTLEEPFVMEFDVAKE